MYILYKTTNIINGNYYIGKHKQKDNFNAFEFDGYLGSGKILNLAILKYGKDNFVRETISIAETDEEISKLELEHITEDIIKDPKCYNIGKGGQGGDIKSPAAKQQLSEQFKKDNPIHKIMLDDEKYTNWKNNVSIGTKKAIKNSQKWKDANIKHTERFNSDNNPGKNKSLETRKKISESKKGKPQKRGKESHNYGKTWVLSEESKRNITIGINKAREKEIHYCEYCAVTIKTNGNWVRHLKGKRHLKSVALVSDSNSFKT